DVDFLVPSRALPGIAADLRAAGFLVERRGDVVRVWEKDADPRADEPIIDLVAVEKSRAQREAVKTAAEDVYRGVSVCIVSRGALVAIKFVSAMSRSRQHLDKLQDAVDIGNVAKFAWTDADAREARRIVEAWQPGAGPELDKLVADLLADRPITI